MAVLKEGDKVPGQLLRSQFESISAGSAPDGKKVALADLVPPGKTLVLYFYPKDSTPGCTREAQGFTASRRAIEKAGGVVVGVSRDSLKSHCSFRDKYGLDIPLLSDPDRVLHEGFGAWGEKVMYGKKVLGAIRSTFLVRDGKIARVWPSVKVDGHVDQVIAALGGADAKAKAKPEAKAKAKASATTRAATAKKKGSPKKKAAKRR